MICSFGCELHIIRSFSAADWIEMENRKGGDIWQGYYSVILSVKFHKMVYLKTMAELGSYEYSVASNGPLKWKSRT
jgi:hypothetical protein